MFSVSDDNRAGYYAYLARLNFECADEADKKIGLLPGYEIAAPPPIMTLCAHSIELSLKSFLLQCGVSPKTVRILKHDLVAAWKKCEEEGANLAKEIPEIDENILAIISDLHVSGRLRYGVRSTLGSVPVYGPLTELCRACLKLCGAPEFSELAAK